MTSNIMLDKALEAIDEKSYEQEWFSNMIINTDDAKAIIMNLVDSQTIEMTENQKNAFDEAKRALNTRDLAVNFILARNGQFLMKFREMYSDMVQAKQQMNK